MPEFDYREYNAAWLKAWSEGDADTLVDRFYSEDVVYKDAQIVSGAHGREELRRYLEGLFGLMPPTRYEPDEIWPLEGGKGYCGRWTATMELADGGTRRFRGFDLCVMDGDRITLNEVYTHDLPE